MKRKETRFTLIEVLIALAVTGIAAMGIFRLQMIGVEAVMHAGLVTRAAVIAESRIDQAIAEARAEAEPPLPDSGKIGVDGMNMEFLWRLEVEDGGADFGDIIEEPVGLWRLRCRVTWSDGARGVELERYLWDFELVQ